MKLPTKGEVIFRRNFLPVIERAVMDDEDTARLVVTVAMVTPQGRWDRAYNPTLDIVEVGSLLTYIIQSGYDMSVERVDQTRDGVAVAIEICLDDYPTTKSYFGYTCTALLSNNAVLWTVDIPDQQLVDILADRFSWGGNPDIFIETEAYDISYKDGKNG